MMGAAESFPRYFLAKIAAIIIFMNYGRVFMRITPLFSAFYAVFNSALRSVLCRESREKSCKLYENRRKS
ncbi:hypothetical protein DY008_16325 [Klebsiella variicola]|nr:hypothetical protein BC497_02495 [Klebsiella variicola]QDI07835.1 hypothetical protein electrica_01658 [Klebsiella electrica]OUY91399.1 hypothetical protein BLL04_20195 [Klebsiella variicola]REI42793.1 hypothetical protein DYB09_25365 [Klebsiella variicola]REI48127.1 hypothetical protein DY002_17740 [Klebsiella variicola]